MTLPEKFGIVAPSPCGGGMLASPSFFAPDDKIEGIVGINLSSSIASSQPYRNGAILEDRYSLSRNGHLLFSGCLNTGIRSSNFYLGGSYQQPLSEDGITSKQLTAFLGKQFDPFFGRINLTLIYHGPSLKGEERNSFLLGLAADYTSPAFDWLSVGLFTFYPFGAQQIPDFENSYFPTNIKYIVGGDVKLKVDYLNEQIQNSIMLGVQYCPAVFSKGFTPEGDEIVSSEKNICSARLSVGFSYSPRQARILQIFGQVALLGSPNDPKNGELQLSAGLNLNLDSQTVRRLKSIYRQNRESALQKRISAETNQAIEKDPEVAEWRKRLDQIEGELERVRDSKTASSRGVELAASKQALEGQIEKREEHYRRQALIKWKGEQIKKAIRDGHLDECADPDLSCVEVDGTTFKTDRGPKQGIGVDLSVN